jgi:hypothetical protein
LRPSPNEAARRCPAYGWYHGRDLLIPPALIARLRKGHGAKVL